MRVPTCFMQGMPIRVDWRVVLASLNQHAIAQCAGFLRTQRVGISVSRRQGHFRAFQATQSAFFAWDQLFRAGCLSNVTGMQYCHQRAVVRVMPNLALPAICTSLSESPSSLRFVRSRSEAAKGL